MFPALALCSDKGLTLKMSALKLYDKLNYAHILNVSLNMSYCGTDAYNLLDVTIDNILLCYRIKQIDCTALL